MAEALTQAASRGGDERSSSRKRSRQASKVLASATMRSRSSSCRRRGSTQEWLAANKDVAKRFGDAIVGAALGYEQSDAASVILAKWTGSKEAKPK